MPVCLSPLRTAYLIGLLTLGLSGCSPNEQADTPVTARSEINLFPGFSQQRSNLTPVLPGYIIDFPFDHASHPDYAIEWWYLTANLEDKEGRPYAMQWTLFRFSAQGNATPWATTQQFMAHASLHSSDFSWFGEKFAREGVGNVGVSTQPFKAHIDNWQWLSASSNLFPANLSFTLDSDLQVELQLHAQQDFVLHGENGFSRKLNESQHASYYYSQPHIEVSGQLLIAGNIVPVNGQAWFDHEWTSQYLAKNSLGWDWFSMHLDNGDKLMLFNMRSKQKADFWSGTLVTANGVQIHLSESQIQARVVEYYPVQGRSLPLQWSIKLPQQGLDLVLKPMKIEQWNPGTFAYYEGGTEISGSHQGVGFIELTGY